MSTGRAGMARRAARLLAATLVIAGAAGCSFDLVETSSGGTGALTVVWESTDSSSVLEVAHAGTPDDGVDRALEVDGGLVQAYERRPNGTLHYVVQTAAPPAAPVTIRPPAIPGREFRPVVGIEPLVMLVPDTLRITGGGGAIAFTGVTPGPGGAGVTVNGFNVSRVTVSAFVRILADNGNILLTITSNSLDGPVQIPTALIPASVSRGTLMVRLTVAQVSETPLRDYLLQVARETHARVPFVVVGR